MQRQGTQTLPSCSLVSHNTETACTTAKLDISRYLQPGKPRRFSPAHCWPHTLHTTYDGHCQGELTCSLTLAGQDVPFKC